MEIKKLFSPVKSMGPDEVREFMQRPQGSCVLLDVRQPKEYAVSHIPGAQLIPLPHLADAFETLDMGTPVIVYCSNGGRSRAAAQLLYGKGFQAVYLLQGGLNAWNGLRVEGPRTFDFRFLKDRADPEHVVMLAYQMEDAVGLLYRDLAAQAADPDVAQVLLDLAGFEQEHKQHVMAVARELCLTDRLEGSMWETLEPGILEGGIVKEDVLMHNRELLGTTEGVFTIGMMLETQAMDLYLRLAALVERNAARQFLYTLAEDEKRHLELFGKLLDEKQPADR